MVETIMRMQTAITALPFVQAEQEGLFKEWLTQMVYPSDPLEGEPNLPLSIQVDTKAFTAWASNDRETLVNQLLAFMEASKFNETELKILKKANQSLSDSRLQAWLSLSEGGGQATGWDMEGVMTLASAMAFIPKGAAKEALQAWYAEYEADACIRVGRSVVGNHYTILHTELFGDTVDVDLQLYLELMDSLEVPPLPEPLLDLISDEAPEYLELSFWLGGAGVLKAGLVIPNPSPDFVRQLAVAYAVETGDTLAAIEGSLGRGEPTSIELARLGKEVQIKVTYQN